MAFYADLHVHSKYSRATSRDCDLEHMALWARKKGISVVGTGDFTHPRWFEEIEEKLVPAEPGLFRLRPDLEVEIDRRLGVPDSQPTRFLLEVEISTIYKKGEKTRKVHHLIYAPDLETAREFSASLGRIGNIASDGRPILGLDSRDLLEIALESGECCYLIPAHIWTPWFAVLGSKSGFDSIEECYGDLAAEIFAVETGLSSDPAMNWRLSSLDGYTLVSNSDAHSPPKLGREACVFDCDMDYYSMFMSLKTREGYGGTVEFFPEEGKYHLDGHRKCGVCLSPEETREHSGLCPVCGKALTLGVMHRVNELADRTDETPPSGASPFRSFVPLEEVISEIQGVGPKSKAVQTRYERLLGQLGSELDILETVPVKDIERAGSPRVAEALARMREGRVYRLAGYDGEYGRIRLFTEEELSRENYAGLMVDIPTAPAKPAPSVAAAPDPRDSHPARPATPPVVVDPAPPPETAVPRDDPGNLHGLDPDQRRAAEIVEGPLLIVAGPGTGKTRTLVHRLAHLIDDRGVSPESCLAITFTRRAAGEMAERLERVLGDRADPVTATTFHGLGWSILREHAARLGRDGDLRIVSSTERARRFKETLGVSKREAERICRARSRPRNDTEKAGQEDMLARALDLCRDDFEQHGLVDFDDLIHMPVRLLDAHPDLVDAYRSRYRWISVDEFQDIDDLQYRLVRHLTPADGNLCAIGDPDQAIYGFRGSDVRFFQSFATDYPSARTVHLTRNYRSSRTIVESALQLIAPSSLVSDRRLEARSSGDERVAIHELATDRAEAEFVVHSIEILLGGSSFFSLDSGRVDSDDGEALSFSDFAVLYRTDAQAEVLREAFERSGMPYQKRGHDRLAERPAVESLIHLLATSAESNESTERAVIGLLDPLIEKVRGEHPEIDLHIDSLRHVAGRHGTDCGGFLSELSLGIEVDLWDPRAERVSLLTLHAAKGLEFPVVFITGCEDGIIPLRWGAGIDDRDLDEERRLFFVGTTRAERRLILTWAARREWRGGVRDRGASPFIEEIEERLLDRQSHRSEKPAGPRVKQLELFG